MTMTTTTTQPHATTLPSFRKKYLNDRDIEAIYGIGPALLRRLRTIDEGPPYKRFGHRIVLYEVGALERWIASLPGGGGEF